MPFEEQVTRFVWRLTLDVVVRYFSLAGLSTASEKKTSLSVLCVSAVK